MKKPRAAAPPPEQGFQAPPADGGLSILSLIHI